MFKELRRKFVLINMSLLTFVFIAIFTAIYVLTAFSGEHQLDMTLEKVMNSSPTPFPGESRTATSLVVELNRFNEIIVFSSFLTMDEEVIKEAVIKAIEIPDATGKIKVGDFHYSFLKKDVIFGTRIAFVDRGPLQDSLRSILVIFAGVAGGSLIILFLISVFLANRAITPIREAFEKQEQFIADASHELKTPLAIIKTNLALILESKKDTVENQLKWIGYIQGQIERMSNLIKDMLTLAKMDSPEQPLFFETLDISNILEGALLYFEAGLFENGIVLETNIQPNLRLYGERYSFEELVHILMDNAIKNTNENGTISVCLNATKTNIELVVKNTGVGIAPENIPRIFERFYREDFARGREGGGYGLGLAIAKSIVQKHGGKIYAESNLGVDTSFIVKLPKGKQ